MCDFFCQAEDGIRDYDVTGVQTCALPIFAVVAVFSAALMWLEFRYALRISMAAAVAVAAYAYYLRACVRRREGRISATKETIS